MRLQSNRVDREGVKWDDDFGGRMYNLQMHGLGVDFEEQFRRLVKGNSEATSMRHIYGLYALHISTSGDCNIMIVSTQDNECPIPNTPVLFNPFFNASHPYHSSFIFTKP